MLCAQRGRRDENSESSGRTGHFAHVRDDNKMFLKRWKNFRNAENAEVKRTLSIRKFKFFVSQKLNTENNFFM